FADGNRDCMGAEIVQHFDAKASNLPFARQRHFRRVDPIGPMGVAAQEMLEPIFDPLDVAPSGLARKQGDTDDSVGENLGAKGAAVRQRCDADLVSRQTQTARYRRNIESGALKTTPGMERLVRPPLHDTIARLDRVSARP